MVSNWDCSLADWLEPLGLLEHVDGVVTSADVGAAKPDAAMFERALALAGVEPAEAVHVGDSVENDVEGARAVGIRAVLVARDGGPAAGRGGDPLADGAPRPTLRADAEHGRAAAFAPRAARAGASALAVVVRAAGLPGRRGVRLITSGILWAATGVDDPSDSPWAIVAGTPLLDGSLVGVGARCSRRSCASRGRGISG